MVLLILNFETGDSNIPYWTIMVTVEGSTFDGDTLSDAFSSYFETADIEDLEFEHQAEDVLNSMGWNWSFVENKIPACKCSYTMWL